MTEPETWTLTVGNGGWVEVAWGEPTRRVLVRMQPTSGGRLRLAELHVEEPTAPLLRSIRLATIEEMLNGPEARAAIEPRLDVPAPDLPRYYGTTFGSAESAARALGYTGKKRPRRTRSRLEPDPAERVRLKRPSGRRLDDSFYAHVAEAYRSAVALGVPPRATLSLDSGAPRDTVTRWIKEARRRGFLGPAQHGRAGEAGGPYETFREAIKDTIASQTEAKGHAE